MTACTQPECTGSIVDGYCDVCGSPAAVVPLAPGAASAASQASAVESARTSNGLVTACIQPGCTGTIVDGYCDVCGSPAGAVLTTCIQSGCTGTIVDGYCDVCGSPAGAVLTTCIQPGCTGKIVDDYCDVCGSPAGAVRLVPAAASTASPSPADEPVLAAVQASTVAPADEEVRTQQVLQVEMPRQQLSTDEMADLGIADRGVVDAQEAETETVGPAEDDGLAEGEPKSAQDYRARVEEAQLPDDVRQAALSEVGKLERPSAGSTECRDIRTWLDTILDLPWSTKITDSIDISESREVEATLRRLIEPPVVDVEQGETAVVEPAAAGLEEGESGEVEPAVADLEEGESGEVEPAVADLEEGGTGEVEPAAVDIDGSDTPPAGPEDDDTVRMPAVPAVLGGDRYQRPQVSDQSVHGPDPVRAPAKKRRAGYLALAAMALAAVVIGALLFAATRDGGVRAQSVPTATATASVTVTKPTNGPSNRSTSSGRGEPTIQLEDLPTSATIFQTVRIKGTYVGGPETFLQAQRQEGDEWLAFPVPAKTDRSGQFTAHVLCDEPGLYRLRVLDPDSGVTSKTFVLVVKG
jgi:hypothetical protein